MEYSPLHSMLDAGVLVLSFNRAHKRNAINNPLARALLAALLKAESDPAVRAVVLRGNGLAFCAGRDVSEAPTEDDLALTQEVALALVRGSKPVVAAVHGWVLGAGLEWMLNADIAVAARSARFRLPEASLGVFVTGGVSALLTRALEPAVVQRFKRVLHEAGAPEFVQAVGMETAAQLELMALAAQGKP
jgi:2-(1,2-epoxy-1,2-dihydrophenyl)acetyl-CoA isomerase